MIPSAEDIEAMKRLRTIMEGAELSESHNRKILHGNREVQPKPIRTGKPDVDAMAEILTRFNKASSDTATRLFEDARTDPRLREALNTEQTDDGMRIGEYEVRTTIVESTTGEKPRKIYHVVNSGTRAKVCDSLSLLEAAHAVVRYLNKGVRLDDKRVQNVLELEETFTRNRMDAARFKYRYERCMALRETQAGNIFADRFQVAKANALVALDQIRNVLGSIR